MPVHLYFSNKLERLAEELAAAVDFEYTRQKNIFEKSLVIAPNANLTKWLQLTLAKTFSLVMNIDFQYLEKGLWSLLRELHSEKEKPELLDKNLSQMRLLYELQQLNGDEDDFAPFHQYLLAPGMEKGSDYDRKLWQLSDRLAILFQEYEFNRPEMLEKWRTHDISSHDVTDVMELCQQKLYLRVRELQKKYSELTGKSFLSMPEYAETLFSSQENLIPKSKFAHFFALSQISRFHLKLIGWLGNFYEIFIYTLNPCQEFWEEIKTPGEKQWMKKKSSEKFVITPEEEEQGELFPIPGDNELLSLWGRPGRESIRMLCQLTDYDFVPCFSEPENVGRPPRFDDRTGGEYQPAAGNLGGLFPSVLGRIQHDILTLSREEDTGPVHQDKSLQIMACPGIRREVETVYNSIIFNLGKDTSLRLTDIAILVPGISKYKPVFEAVFTQKPRALSYNLVDTSAEIESLYGQAVLSLMNLVQARFSRKEVFDLILNPCFMSRWKLCADDIRIWADWADALRIFHCFDAEEKSGKGYPGTDQHTWKQGLQRLRLSRILTMTDEGSPDNFRHFRGIVPFADENSGNAELVEKFCHVIEGLHQAVSELKRRCKTGKEWKTRFLRICDELLEIPSDFRGEDKVRQELIKAFERITFYDELTEAVRADDSEKQFWSEFWSADLITEFIKSGLCSIRGAYGDYLTSGVTISELNPMRPIPFRMIYIMGMEEGGFPGKADTFSPDLRLGRRQIGDISLPEQNCYLFLEMLLSAKEKIYISYVSKDLQKDRDLQPSSVVNQLRGYVETKILLPEKPFEITNVPLKGSSRQYYYEEERNDWSDVLENYSLKDKLAYYRENGLWENIRGKARRNELKIVKHLIPSFVIPEKTGSENARISEIVTLRHLKKFLEDPLEQGCRYHMGLYDDEESVEGIIMNEDEPFYSVFPAEYQLKILPVQEWLRSYFHSENGDEGKEKLEAAYEKIYEHFLRQSKTPEGTFALLDKKALYENIEARFETLRPCAEQMRSADEKYREIFIGEKSARDNIRSFSSLLLSIEITDRHGKKIRKEIKCQGSLPWVWKEGKNGWNALILAGSDKTPKMPDKYILEPVLFYLSCLGSDAACEWIGESPVTFHVVYKDDVKKWVYHTDRDAALSYLGGLISDYLGQTAPEWLPFRTAAKHINLKQLENADEKYKRAFQSAIEESFLEDSSPLVRLARPCIPPNAFDVVKKRLGIFFQHRT